MTRKPLTKPLSIGKSAAEQLPADVSADILGNVFVDMPVDLSVDVSAKGLSIETTPAKQFFAKKLSDENLFAKKLFQTLFFQQKTLGILLLCGLLLGGFGCTRQRYRTNADKDAYELLNAVQQDELWQMQGFTMNEDCRSRYNDRTNPDAVPMPPDDPTAHNLMQEVDGMKGSSIWGKNGSIDTVENKGWEQFLPRDNEGVLTLDQNLAFELALLHSPDYRNAIENVYLSALAVSRQRYAFDVRFYGTDSLYYNNNGGLKKGSTSTLSNTIDAGAKKQFATGAELITDIANSMVWTFGGNEGFRPTTTLSYSIAQPLLRGAGRAIVLESLTQSERQLLANVRQFAFYQQGFYVGVLTGSSPVSSPSSGGYPSFGVSGGGSVGGFYGLLSTQVRIRNQQSNLASLKDNLNQFEEFFMAGRTTNLQVEQARQELLSSQSTLLSQKNNYENSVDSYLMTLGLPPDVPNVKVEDDLLKRFELMSPLFDNLQTTLSEMLAQYRDSKNEIPDNIKTLIQDICNNGKEGVEETRADIARLDALAPERIKSLDALAQRLQVEHSELDSEFCDRDRFNSKVKTIHEHFDRLDKQFKNTLRLLELTCEYDRKTLTQMIIDTQNDPGNSPFTDEMIELIYALQIEDILEAQAKHEDIETLNPLLIPYDKEAVANEEQSEQAGNSESITAAQRRESLKKGLLQNEIISDPTLLDRYKNLTEEELNRPYELIDPYRTWINRLLSIFSDQIMLARLTQARARLEMIQLSNIDISAEEAFEIARENRLDWMNARASLVDSWRNIEIVADDLRAGLSVSLEGSLPSHGSNPVAFSSNDLQTSVRVSFDSPLDRLIERNNYRTVLITYDRARRNYYHYVDQVNSTIRNSLRNIRLNQLDFEVKRESVLAAVANVHQAQLKLSEPQAESGTQVGDTAARDVVTALSSLLSNQNEFMSMWLEYQSQRMSLLLQMGLFQIDENGRWIDPGEIKAGLLQTLNQIDREEAARRIANGDQYLNQTQDQLAGIAELPDISSLPDPDQIDSLSSLNQIRNIRRSVQTEDISSNAVAAPPVPQFPARTLMSATEDANRAGTVPTLGTDDISTEKRPLTAPELMQKTLSSTGTNPMSNNAMNANPANMNNANVNALNSNLLNSNATNSNLLNSNAVQNEQSAIHQVSAVQTLTAPELMQKMFSAPSSSAPVNSAAVSSASVNSTTTLGLSATDVSSARKIPVPNMNGSAKKASVQIKTAQNETPGKDSSERKIRSKTSVAIRTSEPARY